MKNGPAEAAKNGAKLGLNKLAKGARNRVVMALAQVVGAVVAVVIHIIITLLPIILGVALLAAIGNFLLSGGSGGYGKTVSGIDGVPGQIYDFLLDKGMSPIGVAAFLGNIEQESSFDPECGKGGSHIGLCQWDTNDGNRWGRLVEYANSIGASEWEVNTQLNYLWMEIDPEADHTYAKHQISKEDFENLMNANDIIEVTHIIINKYERCPGQQEEKREEYAKKWYEEYQNNHYTTGGGYSNWDGSDNTFGIDIFVNGKVNDANMIKLRGALEVYYGLPQMGTAGLNDISSLATSNYHSRIKASTGHKKYATINTTVTQCTWWANCRVNQYLEAYGTKYTRMTQFVSGSYGDGGQWYDRYKKYFNSGSMPKTNSILSYKNGSYGHVAYVEAYDPSTGYAYISHCGSGVRWYGIDKVKKGTFPWTNNAMFVYIGEPK